MAEVLPRYQTEPETHTFTKRTMKAVKNEKGEHEKFEAVEEEVTADGYMAYFPQGHSIFIEDDKTLALYGLDKDPGLVDMESGDDVPGVANLKNRVTGKTRNIRK